jgi:hypothetical protein
MMSAAVAFPDRIERIVEIGHPPARAMAMLVALDVMNLRKGDRQ